MTSVFVDLDKLDLERVVIGASKGELNGYDTYPLKYKVDNAIVEYLDLKIKFPKCRLPYGMNTQAHLMDVTLGSKDHYKENPVYLKLAELDGRLQDLVDRKLTAEGVEYSPIVQFSKKKVNGELVDNLEYGPHFSIGLRKLASGYLYYLDGVKGRYHDLLDAEGTFHPGSLIQPVCCLNSLSHHIETGKVQCRPKLIMAKVFEDQLDVEFDDDKKDEFVEI